LVVADGVRQEVPEAPFGTTPSTSPPISLEPAGDVEIVDGHLVARSTEPWLRIAPARAVTAHHWVRIRYLTSFFEEPVRPLIRFRLADGREAQQPMNGPVLGSADWVGRVPDGTAEVLISPTNRPGPFEFRVQSVEGASRLKLLARAVRLNPGWALLSLGARLIDSREEARQMLKFAGVFTPLQDYDEWHARHSRPLDLAGIDARHVDWRSGPRFHLLAELGGADRAALERTLRSLRAQAFSDWTLHLLCNRDASDAAVEAYRECMVSDPRLVELRPDAELAALGERGRAGWIGAIGIGDLLPEHALAVFAEALAREPRLSIAYGDEDSIGTDGKLHGSRFKPDWSPYYHAAAPYIGRLTLVRADDLASKGCRTGLQFLRGEGDLVASIASGLPREAVGHVRRLVYRHSRNPQDRFRPVPRKLKPADLAGEIPQPWPSVSVIVPTRDRAKLLAVCLRGLRELTDYPSFDVVMVDNGTAEPAAVALLQEMESVPGFRVVRRPGPFIYSALCNDGAGASQGDVLVFLNNDIAMRDRDWLRPLVQWAVRSDVGAVGAKLLFPNDTLQHAGVVLGMGGLAGHPYRGAPGDHPGYLGRLRVPHEVAAVTGACLAVQRSKFDAIGGFDVVNLPVELNDTDLCLRLAERGWATIWTPESVLYHHESASRGRQVRPFEAYGGQRQYFAQRWAHVIRDDPYFNPALSLFAHRPSLA
jgi:GT2 family glycosyltransferase